MSNSTAYRTHITTELGEALVGETVTVAGFAENIRDHGGIMFLDVRDHYGVVQIKTTTPDIIVRLGVSRECALNVTGTVTLRNADTVNEKIATGTIEIAADTINVLGHISESLPFEISASKDSGEDTRLKYRYLDLRNRKLHDAIVMRSALISFIRATMSERGFLDLQTPIITASSPEGARDFLIPSRRHHGRFYALPQAPQIFKQLYMVSGFDRYFQIAPCFRDEDARADRTAGEFYQLDIEMSFVGQDDVLTLGEGVLRSLIAKFGTKKLVASVPFERIPYNESMLKFGTDKPDLRNPLFIIDLSDLFIDSKFKPFAGKTVRGIRVPGMSSRSKSFFEKMEAFAMGIGMKGLGYVSLDESGALLGPIDKFLTDDARAELKSRAELQTGDVLYFAADEESLANRFAGQIRQEVAARMGLVDTTVHRACFVVDFPMYERDELTGKPVFSHNPFSMPQGGLAALNETADFCQILAYQYDMILDGVELASGAVRNHDPATMVKAFALAGYTEDDVQSRFGALYTAFHYGAPPHAGMAIGIDRLLMILRGEENIREVIAFPLNSSGADVMLGAPSEVGEHQLREAHISVRVKKT